MSGRSKHSVTNASLHIDKIGGVNKFDKDPTLSEYSDYNLVSQKAIVDYVASTAAGKDEFKELNDTPSSYTTANVIYTSNSTPDQVIESGATLTVPTANSFTISRGTSTLTVSNSSTIDQDLSTTSSPTFNNVNITNKLTVGGLMDPTGLQLTPTTANPGDANTFWVDSLDSNKMKKAANTVILGPTSSVDNTLPRFDSSGGNLLQTTNISVDDSDNISGINNIDADGETFRFGNYTTTTDALFHIQSKQQVDLFVEADTDNVTETENPRLILSQDGGDVVARIGLNGDNMLVFGTSSVSTILVNERMRFYCGRNEHTNNGTGNLPTNFIDNTLQLEIYGPTTGTQFVQIHTALKLSTGSIVNEFSTDNTLSGNSDSVIPTEKAIKTYVDRYVALDYSKVIYVNKHSLASDANDGLSPAYAKLTIQGAIDAATSGDVVFVIGGDTYSETLTGKSGVHIYAPMALLNGSGHTIVGGNIWIFNRISTNSSGALVTYNDAGNWCDIRVNSLLMGSTTGFNVVAGHLHLEADNCAVYLGATLVTHSSTDHTRVDINNVFLSNTSYLVKSSNTGCCCFQSTAIEDTDNTCILAYSSGTGIRMITIQAAGLSANTLSNITANTILNVNVGIIGGALNEVGAGSSTIISNSSIDAVPIGVNRQSTGNFTSLTMTNTVNKFSTDGTLSSNSDSNVPTEKAVKTYVDSAVGTSATNGSFSVTFQGPIANQAATIYYSIYNKKCTLSIPTVSGLSVASSAFSLTSPMSSTYRPRQDNWYVIYVIDDNTKQYGLMKVLTTGQIQVYPDATATGNWGGTGGVTGFYSLSVTYILP